MTIETLTRIMAMLRDPQHGCPWDLKQDFDSIAPHTLEEAYEVMDAIEQKDYAHLKNELGDLLFQVVFFARMGEERKLFDFADVVNEISTKLVHRHPHVFPDGTIESFGQPATISPDQVEANWERIKEGERQHGITEQISLLDDVPRALPALNRARKLQKRAASGGFDWEDPLQVMDKLKEEIQELEAAMETADDQDIMEELGDVMFTVVNLSRHLKQDAEYALRASNAKFERRFRYLEEKVSAAGQELRELPLQELEQYWLETKSALEDSTPR